jgi:hypothetical protein
MPKGGRWATAITAPNQTVAEMWIGLLKEHGVPARIRASQVFSYLGVSAAPCDVLVPQELVTKAKELLAPTGPAGEP